MIKSGEILIFLQVAEMVAKFSPDEETKIGAVLVNNDSNTIVASSYNDFIRDSTILKLPKSRPNKYEYIVHAEQNLIFNCLRYGISMKDCSLFCTLSPCLNCIRALWQCGFKKVIVKEVHKKHYSNDIKDIKINIKKSEGYYILEFEIKKDA